MRNSRSEFGSLGFKKPENVMFVEADGNWFSVQLLEASWDIAKDARGYNVPLLTRMKGKIINCTGQDREVFLGAGVNFEDRAGIPMLPASDGRHSALDARSRLTFTRTKVDDLTITQCVPRFPYYDVSQRLTVTAVVGSRVARDRSWLWHNKTGILYISDAHTDAEARRIAVACYLEDPDCGEEVTAEMYDAAVRRVQP